MNAWQPSASLDALKMRAAMLQQIRQFFYKRAYLEVETPQMARHGATDVYLENIQAAFRGKAYYLQTSPEYHMKRLLAAGSGPIFQMARVFRDDELGRWHNPEFTLLEWYQLGIDHLALLDEVDTLLQETLGCPPCLRKTYREAFQEICSFDPFTAPLALLQAQLKPFGLDNILDKEERDRDQYLFLFMSHVIEPAFSEFDCPLALYDFPASQAALAKLNTEGLASRFEVYYRGVELANGFHELSEPALQAKRFKEDCLKRAQKNLPQREADVFLLEALSHGLPECSGVALGVDRLLALALGKNALSQIMAFDFSRA